MASKGRRDAQAAHFLAATHWLTFFGHVHGRIPRPTRARDHQALRDIVQVQAGGSEHRALDLIEAIVRAPVPGDSLADRWLAYWHWTDCDKPKRYTRPTASSVREIRSCIRRAA